jgi:hypothetical protein
MPAPPGNDADCYAAFAPPQPPPDATGGMRALLRNLGNLSFPTAEAEVEDAVEEGPDTTTSALIFKKCHNQGCAVASDVAMLRSGSTLKLCSLCRSVAYCSKVGGLYKLNSVDP